MLFKQHENFLKGLKQVKKFSHNLDFVFQTGDNAKWLISVEAEQQDEKLLSFDDDGC